jgi:uncharacterized protein YndB with AHSA1/START domain
MNTTQSDRIEKKILLRAPQTRVWRALTDSEEFGTWFRMNLESPFTVGKTVRGRITHPGYEHVTLELFSYRWHPYAVDPKIDYSKEPMTLVEFRLEKAPEGTLLTVVESGFDKIPAGRRDEAFRMNSGGWTAQIGNIQRHVAG